MKSVILKHAKEKSRKMFFSLLGLASVSMMGQVPFIYIPETSPPPTSQYDHVGVKAGYTRNFSDEFDRTSTNSPINTSTVSPDWTFDGPSSTTYMDWGASAGSYISFQSNDMTSIDVTNKSLKLDLKKLSPAYTYTPTGTTYNYASEQIKTTRAFGYGYYEARIQLTTGAGSWPAFWMYGNDGSGGPPGTSHNYSEVDIFETFPVRDEVRYTTQTVHVATYTANPTPLTWGPWLSSWRIDTYNYDARYYTGDLDLKDQYHIYGFKFTPDSMIFYLDGYPFRSLVNPHDTSKAGQIFSRMLQNMNTVFGNGALPNGNNFYGYPENGIDYSTPASPVNSIYVDYFRYYKQNPKITTTTPNCITTGHTYTFTASTGISTDTYTWTVGSGCSISSGAGTATCVVTATASPMSVKVRATDVNGNYSETTYTTQSINSDFTLGNLTCSGGYINISASCGALPAGAGNQFSIWNTAGGHFTGTQLQTIGSTSATFTVHLNQGQQYSITNGVWDGCTAWTFTEKVFTVDLMDASISTPACNSGQLQATATAKYANGTGTNLWTLYNCDNAGTITNWTPVQTPSGGSSITYLNLTPNHYYSLYQSMSGSAGSCISSGSSPKVFYVGSNSEDPIFATILFQHTSTWDISATSYSPNGTQYGLFNSDAIGTLGTLTSWGWQTGTNSPYFTGIPIATSGSTYYLVVHGVFSGCAEWRWLGRLFNATTGAFTKASNGVDDQLIYFDKKDIEKLNASRLLSAPSDNEMSLYPNPASGNCKISFSSPLVKGKLYVINAVGQVEYTSEIANASDVNLDLSIIPKGFYLVKVVDSQSQKTYLKKLVVE